MQEAELVESIERLSRATGQAHGALRTIMEICEVAAAPGEKVVPTPEDYLNVIHTVAQNGMKDPRR